MRMPISLNTHQYLVLLFKIFDSDNIIVILSCIFLTITEMKGPPMWCYLERPPPANVEDLRDLWVRMIPLEEEMATHSSILHWRISWTEEPGRL